MNSRFYRRMNKPGHHARIRTRLQLLSAFILLAAGCATTPGIELTRDLPPGIYVFECPIIYPRGFVELTPSSQGVKVSFLERFEGYFHLQRHGEDGVRIVDASIDLPGLRRSFRGEGTLEPPARADGTAVTWLQTAGPVSRNHREGTWTLRPATENEARTFRQTQEELERRRRRLEEAREAEDS